MKKKIKLIPIFLIISLLFVPLVAASGVTIFSRSNDTSYKVYIQRQYPSTDSYISAVGSVFNVTTTGYITSINVWLMRVGTISGTLQAVIEGYNGDLVADTAFPNGTIRGVSTNVVYMQDVSTTKTAYTFYFEGTFQMLQNLGYSIHIQCVQYLSGSGSIAVCGSATDNANIKGFQYQNSAWVDMGTYDHDYMAIQVYGDTEVAATPTPTPPGWTPTPTPTATTDLSGGIWGTLLPFGNVILVLVIILCIAILCGYYGGVWGFFAGLNVAAILVYAIMGEAYFPLWGIVMLAAVDALLLFGKISGGMGRR